MARMGIRRAMIGAVMWRRREVGGRGVAIVTGGRRGREGRREGVPPCGGRLVGIVVRGAV